MQKHPTLGGWSEQMARKRRSYPKKHRELLDSARPYYPIMFSYQGGKCAIPWCSKPPMKRRLDIDHDHKEMYIRGLLCVRCNRALAGWMTSQWLRDAADYLDERDSQWFHNLIDSEGV